jgi:DeoR/GlpR family transcriptional regulator of sugar metabolism
LEQRELPLLEQLDSYEAGAQLKKAMIESAKEIIFTVDSSKFDRVALVSIVPLEA